MSRKSALTISLLCGVSILTLAGSASLVSETAEAGPASRKALSARVSKAGGIRATRLKERLSSRRSLSLSASRRALQLKRFSNTRKLTRTKDRLTNQSRLLDTNASHRTGAGYRVKSKFPWLGKDARFQKLRKANRVRRIGQATNLNKVSGRKNSGKGSGKVTMKDLVTTKTTDKSTPKKTRITSTFKKSETGNGTVKNRAKDVPIIQSAVNGNRANGPKNDAVEHNPKAGLANIAPYGRKESKGPVKWFNPTKGYGFISRDDGGKDVEVFRKLLDQGEAGDNVGVLLRGTKREEVERGQVLSKPGSVTPHTRFEVEAYILAKDEGGRDKSTRQRAILTRPDILLFDEPIVVETYNPSKTMDVLSWSWGHKPIRQKTLARMFGSKAGQDDNAAVSHDGYIPSVEMASGTSGSGAEYSDPFKFWRIAE